MLKINDISTGYGNKQILKNISLEINKGEIVLLTGGNGSGKSTLFKAIFNLIPLWQGEIIYNDEEISNLDSSVLLKKQLIYIPQKDGYFENLSVDKNLKISLSCYEPQIGKQKLQKIYDELPLIFNYRNQIAMKLSGGEKKLLSFAMFYIHNPKLILYDEPLAGVDKSYSKIIQDKIIELNKKEVSFFIIEHSNTQFIKHNRKIVLQSGNIKIENDEK